MGREQRVDGIVGDEAARHPPARGQRVAEHLPLEDRKQWSANLTLLHSLQPPVLDPHGRLLDEFSDVEHRERGQHTDPQHAAPADHVVEQAVNAA
jgi:hypothetical protein